MKQYNEVIIKGLSFPEAKRYIENYKGYTFITRPEWKGFHFIDVYGNGASILDLVHYLKMSVLKQ